jgi:hypothetical protein
VDRLRADFRITIMNERNPEKVGREAKTQADAPRIGATKKMSPPKSL